MWCIFFPLHSSLFILNSSLYTLHSSFLILHFIKYYYRFQPFPFVSSGQKCAMSLRITLFLKNIRNTRPMRLQSCGTAIWAYRLRDWTFVASWLEFNRSGVWHLIADDKNRIVKLYLLKLWLSTHYEFSQISRISNRWKHIFKFAKYRELFVRKNISICVSGFILDICWWKITSIITENNSYQTIKNSYQTPLIINSNYPCH